MSINLNNIKSVVDSNQKECSAIYINGNNCIWHESDYYNQYFTTESETDNNTITLTVGSSVTSNHMTSISYSYDKVNWTTTVIDSTTQTISVTLNTGNKAYWKGIGNALGSGYQNANYWSIFSATGNYKVYGNIASLLFGDSFIGQYTMPAGYSNGRNFQCLFREDTHLTDAKNLIIPFYNCSNNAMANTFYGCSNLLYGPELYFTSIGQYSLTSTFQNCTSMISGPSKLLFNTLYYQSCGSMFRDCKALVHGPKMNITNIVSGAGNACVYMFQNCWSMTDIDFTCTAETLSTSCFSAMFYKCNLLESSFVLPAQTLVSGCYYNMFYQTKVNDITCLATSGFDTNNCLNNWLYDVPSTGTFTKKAGVSWSSGASGIPSGWTINEI